MFVGRAGRDGGDRGEEVMAWQYSENAYGGVMPVDLNPFTHAVSTNPTKNQKPPTNTHAPSKHPVPTMSPTQNRMHILERVRARIA